MMKVFLVLISFCQPYPYRNDAHQISLLPFPILYILQHQPGNLMLTKLNLHQCWWAKLRSSEKEILKDMTGNKLYLKL